MRHAKFEVPNEVISAFSEKMTELDLENTIAGSKHDHIVIEVYYQKNETHDIDELEDYLDQLIEELEDPDEEEENEK